MKRFFFNLCGALNVDDSLGRRFETELQAYQAAQRLAGDIAEARPALRGSSWLSVACEGSHNTLSLGIPTLRQRRKDRARAARRR